LREPVRVNAYATSAAAQPSALQYDDHDVFMLQVSGTKWWRLYRRVAPLLFADDADFPAVRRPEPPAGPVTGAPNRGNLPDHRCGSAELVARPAAPGGCSARRPPSP
jgi:hypothetical protein